MNSLRFLLSFLAFLNSPLVVAETVKIYRIDSEGSTQSLQAMKSVEWNYDSYHCAKVDFQDASIMDLQNVVVQNPRNLKVNTQGKLIRTCLNDLRATFTLNDRKSNLRLKSYLLELSPILPGLVLGEGCEKYKIKLSPLSGEANSKVRVTCGSLNQELTPWLKTLPVTVRSFQFKQKEVPSVIGELAPSVPKVIKIGQQNVQLEWDEKPIPVPTPTPTSTPIPSPTATPNPVATPTPVPLPANYLEFHFGPIQGTHRLKSATGVGEASESDLQIQLGLRRIYNRKVLWATSFEGTGRVSFLGSLNHNWELNGLGFNLLSKGKLGSLSFGVGPAAIGMWGSKEYGVLFASGPMACLRWNDLKGRGSFLIHYMPVISKLNPFSANKMGFGLVGNFKNKFKVGADYTTIVYPASLSGNDYDYDYRGLGAHLEFQF